MGQDYRTTGLTDLHLALITQTWRTNTQVGHHLLSNNLNQVLMVRASHMEHKLHHMVDNLHMKDNNLMEDKYHMEDKLPHMEDNHPMMAKEV